MKNCFKYIRRSIFYHEKAFHASYFLHMEHKRFCKQESLISNIYDILKRYIMNCILKIPLLRGHKAIKFEMWNISLSIINIYTYTMSVVFCKICNNVLDISKTKKGKDQKSDSPVNLSDSDDNADYEYVIDLLAKGKTPKVSDLAGIDFISLQRHPQYKKRPSKERKKIKKAINELLNQSEKDQGRQNVYFVCSSCSYSEKIEPGQLILTRSRASESNREHKSINRWKNLFFSKTLPHTREYTCKNEKCLTHNGVQRSAKFAREANTTETLYFCEVCSEVWKISTQ